MPTAEFRALPLRAHTFLADVELHDVWVVDLPPTRDGVTLAAFNPLMDRARGGSFSGPARALFRLRWLLGRILRLDTAPANTATASFSTRLTPSDRSRSSVEPGTPVGLFRAVYRFEDEALLELRNRTTHAAAVTTLVRAASTYRFYLAVYVAQASWFARIYLALIDPFRRWIVYPAMLENIRAAWFAFAS